MLNWGKLVSQGRAKAAGVSWSDEEMKAIALLCKTFDKTMSEVAPYIREGILTVEGFKKAQAKPGAINPFLKLSQKDLIKKAQAMGLSATPDATKEVLAQAILEEKQKLIAEKKAKAEAEAKVKEEAKIKEKTEAEVKAKAKAKAEAEAKAKPKPKAKPKVKPKATPKKTTKKKKK